MSELCSDIGLYPVPLGLSVSNLIKGWFLVTLFTLFCLVDFQLSTWTHIISFVIPESTTTILRKILNDAFWQLLLYLINKRKIKIIISGINLKDVQVQQQLKSSIVISNHKSLFDYMLMYYLKTLVEKASGEPVLLSFFNWNLVWQAPGLKLFRRLWQNDENWEMNVVELEQSLQTLTQTSANNWIAHFPEVNICTNTNWVIQNLQLDKHNLPRFEHLLYPRFNNFSNLIKAVRNNPTSPLKNLLGLTILYYNPVKNIFTNPTLFEIVTLKQPVFIISVDFHIKHISKLPLKARKLDKWLENEWLEKDKILDAMQTQLKLNVD